MPARIATLDADRIVSAYEAGDSIKKIADDLGVSEGPIARRLDERGVKRHPLWDPKPVMERLGRVTRDEWIWISGFFDGEGHIGIVTSTRGLILTFTNTDLKTIEWLHQVLGGCLTRVAKNRAFNQKDCYRVVLVDRQAAEICRRMTPYLRIRLRQCLVAIEFIEARLAKDTEKMLSLKEELRTLNRRGPAEE